MGEVGVVAGKGVSTTKPGEGVSQPVLDPR
jgi:hypothetical protein